MHPTYSLALATFSASASGILATDQRRKNRARRTSLAILTAALPTAFLHAQPRRGLRVFRLEPGFHFAAAVRRFDPISTRCLPIPSCSRARNISAIAAQMFAVSKSWAQQLASAALRSASGSHRMSAPSSASKSKAYA